MFERFTDRSRRVVVLAQEEARLLKHSYIGTEHVLLGLIHEGEGVAAKVLHGLGIDLGCAREQLEKMIGAGSGPIQQGHLPFTPRTKRVFELSLREGLQLGHNYIGTEHILLAVVREGEGVGCQIMAKLGADLATVRQAVIDQLRAYQKPPAPKYLRSPNGTSLIDADLPGVDTLTNHGWTLVERVVGPVVCTDCRQTHTCERYIEVAP